MNYLETDQGKKLFTAFLKKYQGKGSEKVYRSEIRLFFNWYDGELDSLTRDIFERYGKYLSENAGAKTVKRKFSILNQFFKFLEAKVKDFSSPIGKAHGDIQSLQSALYHESETFIRNLEHWKGTLNQPTTKKTYGGNVRLFFEWSRKAPGDLSQTDFTGYRDYLINDRKNKPSTVWNKFISINRFLVFLSEKSRNFANPLEFGKLNLTKAPKDAGYQNVLTYSEVKALLKSVDRRKLIGKRDYAVLMLMLVYGLRAGEVCKLRYRDIEPERVKGQQKIWLKDRKGRDGNRKDTALILNGNLLQAWDSWLNSNGIRYKPDTPVFAGFIYDRRTKGLEISQKQVREQKPLTVSTIENIVAKYMNKAGINPGTRVLSPHSLRHTAFTDMSKSGTPLAKIRYIAGHQDVNTTMIYTHHGEDYDDNIGMKSSFNK